MNIFDLVKGILVALCDIDADRINLHTKFRHDLYTNGFVEFEILMQMEEILDIDMTGREDVASVYDFTNETTIEDFVLFIEDKLIKQIK